LYYLSNTKAPIPSTFVSFATFGTFYSVFRSNADFATLFKFCVIEHDGNVIEHDGDYATVDTLWCNDAVSHKLSTREKNYS